MTHYQLNFRLDQQHSDYFIPMEQIQILVYLKLIVIVSLNFLEKINGLLYNSPH